MNKIKRYTPLIGAVLMGWGTVSIGQTLSNECQCAVYSLDDRILNVPVVEVPTTNLLTDQPTGDIETFTGALRQFPNQPDYFEFLCDTYQVTENRSECPASYDPETGLLELPCVEVPIGIPLCTSKCNQGATDFFQATLKWEPEECCDGYFVIQELTKLNQPTVIEPETGEPANTGEFYVDSQVEFPGPHFDSPSCGTATFIASNATWRFGTADGTGPWNANGIEWDSQVFAAPRWTQFNIGGLVAVKNGDVSSAFFVGLKKTVSLDKGDALTFVINDKAGLYSDNEGIIKVTWSFQEGECPDTGNGNGNGNQGPNGNGNEGNEGQEDNNSTPVGTVRGPAGKLWLKDMTCLCRQNNPSGETMPINTLQYNPTEFDRPGAQEAVALLQSGECGLADDSNVGDWRIPTFEELETMTSSITALENNGISGRFWSTTQWPNGNLMKVVHTNGNLEERVGDTDRSCVWAVRDDNGNGTTGNGGTDQNQTTQPGNTYELAVSGRNNEVEFILNTTGGGCTPQAISGDGDKATCTLTANDQVRYQISGENHTFTGPAGFDQFTSDSVSNCSNCDLNL